MTNANNFLEPSTILTDKVELIELPNDSILPTGFRFVDLSILSDVFSLLACTNCSTTNTPKLQDAEDKKKALACELSIAFILHLKYTAPKTIVAEKWKIWTPALGLYTVTEISGLVIHHLLSGVVSWSCHHQWPKKHMVAY